MGLIDLSSAGPWAWVCAHGATVHTPELAHEDRHTRTYARVQRSVPAR
jgi:hypothetical protein